MSGHKTLSLIVTMAGEKRRLGTPSKLGVSEILFNEGCLISKSCLLIINKHRGNLGDLEESLCPGFQGDFSVLKPDFEQAFVSEYFLSY